MFVRLALESDMEEIVNMAYGNVTETLHDRFVSERVRDTFRAYLAEAQTTFFVCEDDDRKVIGFLQASIYGYDFRDGHYTCQKVMYVKPENRGTRAAMLLMMELIKWSQMIGADKIEGGNDNDFQSERTAKFLSHFGFEKVGYAMRLKLDKK